MFIIVTTVWRQWCAPMPNGNAFDPFCKYQAIRRQSANTPDQLVYQSVL